VPACAGERDQLLTRSGGQFGLGGPVLEQPQDGGRAQVVAGQDQRRRVGGLQVRAQPVEQPALVARGAVVVAGDRAPLAAELAVRDERAPPGVSVQGEQAADPGVLGVVLLPRRASSAGDHLGVDRDHGEPGVDQRLDQQPVPGLQHHADLGRVRFQCQAASDQPLDPGRAVRDAELLDHPFSTVPRAMS